MAQDCLRYLGLVTQVSTARRVNPSRNPTSTDVPLANIVQLTQRWRSSVKTATTRMNTRKTYANFAQQVTSVTMLLAQSAISRTTNVPEVSTARVVLMGPNSIGGRDPVSAIFFCNRSSFLLNPPDSDCPIGNNCP
ncbi:hypothetical protein MAR_036222 [Mya arenaria]|uniref:Uncharacterized protein n=1 Tax=Mya arenaria TaxID=6604 RepID=A0ABY7EQP8_MYAAR|nr:hypothetical protein MAR_036222 [Mya arenaria]